MSRFWRPLAALLLAVAACDRSPTGLRRAAGPPAFVISDGAHTGNNHFYFLPPAVPAPTVSGVFDRTQTPVVEICVLQGGACTLPLIARFTTKPPDDDDTGDEDQGPRPEFIKVSPRRGWYRVRWHTNEYNLDTAKTYRIAVKVGAVTLGIADVDVAANKRELRNVNTGEFVPLVEDKTLPIKFRIEQGAVTVVAPGSSVPVGAAGGNVTRSDGAAAVVIPAGALAATTNISIAQVAAPPAGAGKLSPVFDLGPNGTTFAQPVTLTMQFAPDSLPAGLPPSELAMMVFDGTGWDYVPGSVVDVAAHTVSAPLSHFSLYTIGITPRRANFTTVYDTASVGRTSVYGFVVFDSLGAPVRNVAVHWTSDYPAIASIPSAPVYTDAQGFTESPTITANSAGITSIRAHVGAQAATRTFTVLAVAPPTPGPSIQLASGGKSTCERQLAGTVFCWGETSYGATDAPEDVFTTIGGGGFHYCGIRANQTLGCWGYNSDLRATPPAGTFTQLAVGAEHNCAVRTDGTAVCWGFGGDGRSSPPAGTYKQVAVGWVHGCGIRTDDTIACWGQNTAGQTLAPAGTYRAIAGGAYFTCAIRMDYSLACFGDAAVSAPNVIPQGQFYQLGQSVGGHMCAIRFDGTLACWGQNDFGQAVARPGTFVQVSEGGWHTCGVHTDQTLECWGSNATGATDILPVPPLPPAPLAPGAQVISGGKSTCERPLAGQVWCWGETSYGATDATTSAFSTVGGGGFHYCGIKTNQQLECWGYNSDNRAVPPAGSFSQISVSAEDACALRTDNTAACWGFTADGRGIVPAGTYKQIAVGWYHGCAIKPDDTLACWGRAQSGAEIQPPVGLHFREIAANAFATCGIRTNYMLACFGNLTAPSGYFIAMGPSVGGHMCAIRFDRTLACWGQNDFGQATAPAGQFAQVSEGGWHSCGVKTDQSVVCWGSNATGATDVQPQPPTPPLPPGPQVVSGGKSTCERPLSGPVVCWGETSYGATAATASAFTTVGGGGFHYCGILTSQSLECWGYNSDNRATPPSGSFQQLSVSAEDACALRTDGTAACWGFTADGRGVVPPGTYKQITLGWYHGCAIRPDNTLACWGRAQSGAEIQPPAGVTFREIAASAFATCGIRTNYTLACFGDSPTPPAGSFIALGPSVGGHLCAIRFDRSLACWGQNDFGQANPPSGQFLQVSEGGWHSCGVRVDHSVACWGSNATGALDIPVNQWSPAASMTSRVGFGGAINGTLYVAGGVSNNVFYDILEAYDPATNSWSARAPMALERVFAASAVIGGKLYVVGGIDRQNNSLARLDVYDPATNAWTTRAPMPRARTYLAAAASGGKLYVFGGATGDGVPFQSTAVTDVDIYDPATDTWTSGAPMPAPRYTMTAATFNGRIYIVGGYGPADGYQQPLYDVPVYDPATDSWSSIPNTIQRRGQAPAVAGLNGRLYVSGGFCFNCGNALQSLEVYDPATNAWTMKASMVQGRWGAVADVINGAIYAAGGAVDGGAATVGSLEIYHP